MSGRPAGSRRCTCRGPRCSRPPCRARIQSRASSGSTFRTPFAGTTRTIRDPRTCWHPRCQGRRSRRAARPSSRRRSGCQRTRSDSRKSPPGSGSRPGCSAVLPCTGRAASPPGSGRGRVARANRRRARCRRAGTRPDRWRPAGSCPTHRMPVSLKRHGRGD